MFKSSTGNCMPYFWMTHQYLHKKNHMYQVWAYARYCFFYCNTRLNILKWPLYNDVIYKASHFLNTFFCYGSFLPHSCLRKCIMPLSWKQCIPGK
jgi:hypothetical protein